jgi:hypothetical protein
MGTAERDAEAHAAYASGKTWAQVAVDLHYANGSVARRAAMRHLARTGEPMPTPAVEPTVEADAPVEPDTDQQPTVEPTLERPVERADGLPDWTEGTALRHDGEPKATYRFVRWNRDGSAQVWGGDAGHEMYRDFRVGTLRPITIKAKAERRAA